VNTSSRIALSVAWVVLVYAFFFRQYVGKLLERLGM